jgi:hypothetical protein
MTVRARPAAREVSVRGSELLLDVYITDFRLFLAFDYVLVITRLIHVVTQVLCSYTYESMCIEVTVSVGPQYPMSVVQVCAWSGGWMR